MRPKYSNSTKIIKDIMFSFDRNNYLITKFRLRNNYKHLKYLWKYHAKKEGKFFKLRQDSFIDTDVIINISNNWQSSYRIQQIMSFANVWKWMIIK